LIGANLFEPRFDLQIYETRVDELAVIGTFILKVTATDADKNGTSHSLVKYSMQPTGDFYDYFEIDKMNASIYLKKSLLLLKKSALYVDAMSFDQGTPRKSDTALVKVDLNRSLSCNDIFNPVLNKISLSKSSTSSMNSFELKPGDFLTKRNFPLVRNLGRFLTHYIYLNETTGTVQVNSSIFAGSYELNVFAKQFYKDAKQFYKDEVCEKKMNIGLRVFPETTTSTTTSTTATSILSSLITSASFSSPSLSDFAMFPVKLNFSWFPVDNFYYFKLNFILT